MKKIFFALALALTLGLSSCWETPTNIYTGSFSRVVTIDTTDATVKLVADYTGEVFKDLTNLKYTEQLSQFGLASARRAEVMMQVEVNDMYEQKFTMLYGRPINIQRVSNTVPTEALHPLSGWQLYPLGGTEYTPAVWVHDGYLNILPVIPSLTAGRYYLTPDSAVSDTLHFSLKAGYTPSAANMFYENIQCYDLRTLRDTAKADAEMRGKMEAMLSAMDALKKDSMRIVVTSLFDIHYYEKDTIMEQSAMTNFFKYNF